MTDEIFAVQVEFNAYYNSFIVLTKIDVRVYDALSGKLRKVFNDLFDERYIVDLTAFCFGARQRKFYVADNSGHIRVYNMKGGEFVKKVNQSTNLDLEFPNKTYQFKKKENLEIS